MKAGRVGIAVLVVIAALLAYFGPYAVRFFRYDYPCASNIECIAMAMSMYCTDWGQFPDPDHWVDQLGPEYVRNMAVFKCPADRTEARSSYGMNRALGGVRVEDLLGEMDDLVSVYETAHPGDNPSGGPEDVVTPPRHPRSREPYRRYEGNMYGYVSGILVGNMAYKVPHYTTFEVEVRPGTPSDRPAGVEPE